MAISLIVRQSPDRPWVRNFSAYGWKVRSSTNGSWINMTPTNTKVRSMDNTQWLSVK
jgi:hypothetical protein